MGFLREKLSDNYRQCPQPIDHVEFSHVDNSDTSHYIVRRVLTVLRSR
jgi:hypothetical protein